MSAPVWFVASPPASEPLTLEEMKNYLKVPSVVTDDDDLITSMIIEARQFVERNTGRALINRTITQVWDELPAYPKDERVLDLHITPFYSYTAATAFSYIAEGGDPSSYTAWDNATVKYYVDRLSGQQGLGGPRLVKKVGTDWPTLADYKNAVTFTYIAGYGTAATDIPAPILTAMRRLVGLMYTFRVTAQDDFEAVRQLLKPYQAHK